MSRSVPVMSFEEFRAAHDTPYAEVVRQQRAHFRDAHAAVLTPERIGLAGWAEWPDGARVDGWVRWDDARDSRKA